MKIFAVIIVLIFSTSAFSEESENKTSFVAYKKFYFNVGESGGSGWQEVRDNYKYHQERVIEVLKFYKISYKNEKGNLLIPNELLQDKNELRSFTMLADDYEWFMLDWTPKISSKYLDEIKDTSMSDRSKRLYNQIGGQSD